MGSKCNCSAVMRCRLPNRAFDDVSLHVSATPSHRRTVQKNGKNQPVWVNARRKTASVAEYRVTNPSPSIPEIASTANRMRKSVCPNNCSSFNGRTPRIVPPTMAARKQPVPVAESQMKGNFAPSGVGFGTTGLSREIIRCSGVFYPPLGFPSPVTQEGVVWMFIPPFTGLYPHRDTKRERIRNGTQALETWLFV